MAYQLNPLMEAETFHTITQNKDFKFEPVNTGKISSKIKRKILRERPRRRGIQGVNATWFTPGQIEVMNRPGEIADRALDPFQKRLKKLRDLENLKRSSASMGGAERRALNKSIKLTKRLLKK